MVERHRQVVEGQQGVVEFEEDGVLFVFGAGDGDAEATAAQCVQGSCLKAVAKDLDKIFLARIFYNIVLVPMLLLLLPSTIRSSRSRRNRTRTPQPCPN